MPARYNRLGTRRRHRSWQKRRNMSNANTSERTPNRRRWSRAALILCVLLWTLAVLIPSRAIYQPTPPWHTAFIHGWPLEIMRSGADASIALSAEQGNSFGFTVNISPIQGYYYDFQLFHLLIDLMIGCAVSAIAVAIGKFWWRQKHRLQTISWAVIVLSMAIIILSGLPITSSPEDEQYMANSDWKIEQTRYKYYCRSFGWPLEFMRTPILPPSQEWKYCDWVYSLSYMPYWIQPHSWTFQKYIYQFNLLYLIADLMIGGLIIWGFTRVTKRCFCQPSSKAKKQRFSFSITALLAIVTLFAFTLSWYRGHTIDRLNEKACAAQQIADMQANLGSGGLSPTPGMMRWRWLGFREEYQGPDWLRRLIGNDQYLTFCFHSNAMEITASGIKASGSNAKDVGLTSEGDEVKRKLRLIGGCRRTEAVSFLGIPTVELIQTLSTLPRLRKLRLQTAPPPTTGFFGSSMLPTEKEFAPDAIVAMSECSNLESLVLKGSNVLVSDLKQLSQLPRLERLEFQGEHIFADHLSVLEQFPNLKTVDLKVAASDSEMQQFQKDHPNITMNWDNLFEVHYGAIDSYFERVTNCQCDVSSDEKSCQWEELKAEHLVFLQDTTLKKYVNQIHSLEIYAVDKPQTAVTFIQNCQSLKEIQISDIVLSSSDFEAMRLPKDLESLEIQQGTLTVQDCQRLMANSPRLELGIWNATFTEAEIIKIQSVSPECGVIIWDESGQGTVYKFFERETR